MRTPKQSEASRRNGARSKGPVTAEGKQRSSRNALKHGLLAERVLLANESHEDFDQFSEELMARLAPTDRVEYRLVEEMAYGLWRLRRAWSIEATRFDQEMSEIDAPSEPDRLASAFKNMTTLSNEFSLLQRYESRLSRIFHRGLRNIAGFRAVKLRNEPEPIPPDSQ